MSILRNIPVEGYEGQPVCRAGKECRGTAGSSDYENQPTFNNLPKDQKLECTLHQKLRFLRWW